MAGYKILLVEDDQSWIDILERKIRLALKNMDHSDASVTSVNQFDKAYNDLKEKCWNLLVTDIGLGDPQESLKKKGNLLLDLAHDLKVPAIAVSGTSSLTKRDVEDLYERYFAFNFSFFDKIDFNEERFVSTVQELLQRQNKINETPVKEVFVSHAWEGESEKIVDQLDQAFQAKGITIVRDKRDLGYKGLIKDFMRRIGRGKCVVVVISEAYLKSENCMFELVQIAKNGNLYNRIFPIVLNDAQIYKPSERIKYVQYWEQQIKELDEAMRSVSAANLQGFREDIDLYTEIRNAIATLTDTFKDMHTLTVKVHSESGFNDIFKAIEQKIVE